MTENIPSKSLIKETYEKYLPYLKLIMSNIHSMLLENISLSSQPTYKLRLKSFDSYYKKILRQKPREAENEAGLVCITDIIGIRIICAFLEDIEVVQNQLSKLFTIREIEIKGASQTFKEFGYESVHVLIELPNDALPKDAITSGIKIPADLVCEIQIRTILQDAWAEVEHELIYKTEFTPFDMPLRRKLAAMNASLSLADIIFQEIRDYQSKLQNELNKRRASFYQLADDLTTNTDTDTQKDATRKPHIDRVNPYVTGTIDDLILQAIHAHNEGDLSRAVYIYSEIINSSPKPNNIVLSVIHKHRGMAFFTQSNYSAALSDFKDSFSLDGTNFRSVYYEGIVNSIQKNYEAAIECFTKSLSINKYQSHAFFRRAFAYYTLNDYEKAMSDVVAAKKLGLVDAGLDKLHTKLLEKFDMKF